MRHHRDTWAGKGITGRAFNYCGGIIILIWFAGRGITIGNDSILRLAVSLLKKRLILLLSTLLATGKQA
jgi:hypothetical protein